MELKPNIFRGRPWLMLLMLFAWLLPQQAAAETFVEKTYQYMVMLNGANTIRIKAGYDIGLLNRSSADNTKVGDAQWFVGVAYLF